MPIPPMLATLGTLGGGLGIALLLQNGVNVATYALNPVATGHVSGRPTSTPPCAGPG
jgi:ribose transport system permease protein